MSAEPTPEAQVVHMARSEPSAIEAATSAALAMPGVPGRDEFVALAMQARMLSMSGAAPDAVRGNPHVAFHLAMIGRDLGISPSAAVELIDVISSGGKVRLSLSPQLLNGQVRRLGLGSVVPVERTEERCVAAAVGPRGLDPSCGWPLKRRDHVDGCRCDVLGETEFTWADAQAAGLVGDDCAPGAHSQACGNRDSTQRLRCNQGYRTYPKRMLWWRACLPERAEALTPGGWVRHEKLTVGDRVLAFDQEVGRTAWATVTALNVYEARQTYTIEHRSYRMVATAGHEWVVDDWRRPGSTSKRRTDELDAHPYRRLVAAAPMADAPSDVSALDAARLGWLLTDGTIQWRGNSPTVTISQTKHVDVVRSLFPTAHETILERPGGFGGARPEHRFRLSAGDSRRLLAAGGIATKDDAASIPARLSTAGRRAMLEAMELANGQQFCTGHRAVMDCWQILSAMLGHRTGVARFNRGAWRTRRNNSPVVSIKRLSVTPLTVEPVWCPTTTLGTWVARLDGQVTITGNSGFAVDDFFPEAGLGLYSPEELGAVIDVEGRPVDPASVELPDGYGPVRAEPEDPADPEALEGLRARVKALPAEHQAFLKERWRDQEWPPLDRLPARLLGRVSAFVLGVEGRAKAAGWSPPDADADAEAPQATQEPAADVPAATGPDEAAAPLGDATAALAEEQEPEQVRARVARTVQRLTATADAAQVDRVVDVVKQMHHTAVDKALKLRGWDPTGQLIDTRRMLLTAALVHEENHPDVCRLLDCGKPAALDPEHDDEPSGWCDAHRPF